MFRPKIETHVVVKKEFNCFDCGAKVAKDDFYVSYTGEDENGDFMHVKSCMKCSVKNNFVMEDGQD